MGPSTVFCAQISWSWNPPELVDGGFLPPSRETPYCRPGHIAKGRVGDEMGDPSLKEELVMLVRCSKVMESHHGRYQKRSLVDAL